MPISYIKDPASGVVLLNSGVTLESVDPTKTAPLDYYLKTHFSGDIFIPTGEQEFEIIFKTKNYSATILRGITPTLVKGQVCPLKAYIKIMPTTNEPADTAKG